MSWAPKSPLSWPIDGDESATARLFGFEFCPTPALGDFSGLDDIARSSPDTNIVETICTRFGRSSAKPVLCPPTNQLQCPNNAEPLESPKYIEPGEE